MIFYFSGTGNSKWIAQQLAAEQQDSLLFIPDEMRVPTAYALQKDEKIGFVFPIYSWGPPKVVLEFIRIMNFTNYKNHFLYFVCSCGDDIGLTKEVFEKAVVKKGWACNAGFSVIMPNTYVLLPGFDVDSKECEHRKLDDAVSTMKKINKSITLRKNEFHCKKGIFSFIKTRLIYPVFKVSAKPFYATDACIACKRCEQVCPMKNIAVDKKPIWGDLCTSCLACYHICPQKAVQYGKTTRKKGQYFNPEIRKNIK